MSDQAAPTEPDGRAPDLTVGVVAVQGAFMEHATALRQAAGTQGASIEVVEVRRPAQAARCHGIVMPGGESTAIYKLLRSSGLFEELQSRVREGTPLLATCAGAILAASQGDDQVQGTDTELLGLLDAAVDRNAFGRQRESFEGPVHAEDLGPEPFPGVFIRAPRFRELWARAEPWARLADGEVVGARQGNVLALTFHPELSPDTRVHEHFLDRVSKRAGP